MRAYSGSAPPSQARKVHAGGLEHHVLEWSSSNAGSAVLLLHGYMDVADSWAEVAPSLSSIGYATFAPDLRGFGDAPRAAAGSYYYFADYVADVAALADALSPERPVIVVGHSMGGVVGTLFAGSFPERVAKLVNLEGLGPPDSAFDVAPERMREFVSGVRKYSARDREAAPARTMADLDEVVKRLAAQHPSVDPAVLRARAPSLVRRTASGGLTWRFDPLHRARSPFPFYARAFQAFAADVECPVLFVSGGPQGWHPSDEGDRLAAFADLRTAELPDAGHMMHWTRPRELCALITGFLGEG